MMRRPSIEEIRAVMNIWSLQFIASMDPQLAYAVEKLLAKAIAYGKKQCETTSNPPTA